MVSSKLLALGASALVAGLIGGILIAASVPGFVAPYTTPAPDGPGTVIIGEDQPRATPCAWHETPLTADQMTKLTLNEACGVLQGEVTQIAVVVRGERTTFHFTVLPDAPYKSMANSYNDASWGGALVIEVALADQDALPHLHIGQHLEVQGPFVTDIEHQWNEIHPAKIVTVLA